MNKQFFVVSFLCFISMMSFNFAMQDELSQKSFNNKWAEHDLAYIYQIIMEDHPGIYNKLDPEFITHMKKNFIYAQEQLVNATTDKQCMQTIISFVKSFNDNHMGITYDTLKPDLQHTQDIKNDPLISIIDIQDTVHWINLPTFWPDSKTQNELTLIIEKMPMLRASKFIVFDVRGNRGGNSFWGLNIIKSLFGQAYVERLLTQANALQYIDWRISRGNIEHLKAAHSKFVKDFGENAESTQWLKKVLTGMTQAYVNGDCYYREYQTIESIQYTQDAFEHMVTAQIIVIIDSHCASACLDFLDDLKTMNYPVTLIGQTTKADTVYMEVRTVTLPSNKGTFYFPIKVYRNRPRGHNVPYRPDVYYKGDITNTKDLQRFVVNYLQGINFF